MLKRIDPARLLEKLRGAPKVLITMHRGPDGDAMGSSLALDGFLKSFGIKPVVVAPDDFPAFLKWLPGHDDVLIYENDSQEIDELITNMDLIFCLDFNHPGRLAKFQNTLNGAKAPKFIIDHHRDPNPFGDEYYVDQEASSTAELIYRLIEEMGETDRINKDTALCLYTGLVTDTGSFRFDSVTPDVMRIAAELMKRGIDHTKVYDEIYDNSTLDRLKLRGYALSNKTVVVGETGAAYISLTNKELERFNFHPGDTEGLVNYALGLAGVHVAGFFYERDGYIKISLRSKGKIDVNEVASAYFNGGGHKNAAGGRSNESLDKTVKRFETIARRGFEIERVEE